MASISGQNTSNIDQVDGFFTTQGGSGISPNPIATTGTQLTAGGSLPFNPSVPVDFNRSPVNSNVFVKMTASGQYNQILAIKADGTLWYYATQTSWISGFVSTLNAWTQYGTDTDWEDVEGGSITWAFIKGGEYWFMGYGGYRTRGDGTTLSSSSPVLINNSKTWTQCAMSLNNLVLLSSDGQVWTAGRNLDYGTGQGTTSGYTTTLTREQNNITGATFINAGYYATTFISGGNIYHTGNNQGPWAGPLIGTSSADVNGPTLSYNGGDMVQLTAIGSRSALGIDTSGNIRFSGEAGQRQRPDNNTTDHKATSGTNIQWGTITGIGLGGWTYVKMGAQSSAVYGCIGIRNGQIWMGGTSINTILESITTGTNGYWRQIGTSSNGSTGIVAGTSTVNVKAAYSFS